jgi:hypothetical protein
MPPSTTFDSISDAILKEYYVDGKIEPQVITDAVLLKRIEGSGKDIVVDNVGGKYVVFPIQSGLTQGLGARGRGEPNPLPRGQQYKRTYFPLKKLVTRVQIEGEAWRASEGAGKKAFISLLAAEIERGLESHSKDMNGQLYGDGTGKRATVSTGSVAGQAVTIVVDDARLLWDDMLIDVYAAGATVPKATGLVVTSVDRVGLNVVIEDTGAVAIAATDFITRNGNYNKEVMGLDGIVNDSTGLASLQGITVASALYWQALNLANGGAARDINKNILSQAYLYSFKQDHTPPNVALCNEVTMRYYEQMLVDEKRFTASNGRPILDAGYERLAYNNIPVEFDTDCQAGRWYFLKTKYIKLFRQTGYRWQLSPDMKNYWKPVEGMDAYEATAYWEGEMATKRRNAHARISDLQTA